MSRRLVVSVLALALVATACGSGGDTPGSEAGQADDIGTRDIDSFPPAPETPSGPLADAVTDDLDAVFGSLAGTLDFDALERLGQSGDPRVAWLLSDILRFARTDGIYDGTAAAWESLTGVTVPDGPTAWGFTTDHLIAWDLPAPPGYVDWKRQAFELVDARWSPFFDDTEATIDWRWVSWGGVLIDDRPLDVIDQPCPEGCIPALNDPALTDAAGGDWYPDDSVVFGVVIGDEAVAFPKNIMEVHEMVNITIGNRRLGIPYCTLCGSAQAYVTDDVAPGQDLDGEDSYELRTSGLLSRSNKVMYEWHTKSVFDTFTGEAVTGPLREEGVTLEQVTVQTSTWGDWKAAHPDTKIVAEDGGIGRSYPADPLGGRDDAGPIFPIGDVDGRLGVQEAIVGVVATDGTAVAFPVEASAGQIVDEGDVSLGGVTLLSDGAGFTAEDSESGATLATHEAFWFSWSQFHPDTLLWVR